jgi:hypothetical protein
MIAAAHGATPGVTVHESDAIARAGGQPSGGA